MKSLTVIIVCIFVLFACVSCKLSQKIKKHGCYSEIKVCENGLSLAEYEQCLKSCAINSPLCQRSLGLFYLRTNVQEALFWYKLASINGDSFATYVLGMLYSNGEFIKKDLNLAKEYFYKSALISANVITYIEFLVEYFPRNVNEISIWNNIAFDFQENPPNFIGELKKLFFDNYIITNSKQQLNREQAEKKRLLSKIIYLNSKRNIKNIKNKNIKDRHK